MGPITLFDKSFLQSLSEDEAVLFDNFFITAICPLFFVETLADLTKTHRDGRDPLREVAVIASKTPEMRGAPCAHHERALRAALMGMEVPMTGQIPLPRGRPVRHRERKGYVFEQSPEAKALQRWQDQEFYDVEYGMARAWRASLEAVDLDRLAQQIRASGINAKTCKSLEQAKAFADGFVSSQNQPFRQIEFASTLLNLDRHQREEMLQRWRQRSGQPLNVYAPYAAHVVAVEVFFRCALAAGLIGTERASNRVDMAYLFYLPFCMLFVSSDKLHNRCARLFLRKDQSFVWGPDLKADLARLNAHYSALAEEVRDTGLMRFASAPPDDASYLVRQLWDQHLGSHISPADRKEPEQNPELVKDLNEFARAPRDDSVELGDVEEADAIAIERKMRRKRGSYWQVPKNLKDQPGE